MRASFCTIIDDLHCIWMNKIVCWKLVWTFSKLVNACEKCLFKLVWNYFKTHIRTVLNYAWILFWSLKLLEKKGVVTPIINLFLHYQVVLNPWKIKTIADFWLEQFFFNLMNGSQNLRFTFVRLLFETK